ncbi:MAG: dicarboxylate transporter subunit DctP [candidate division NC10 bacterium]|jgi:tripartite ATP-independent transporter DctP family solute receptor|nr:dicarboxylate transporter subunit DctP [candidate division NC10 bacterium]
MKRWLSVPAGVGLLCVLATAVQAGTIIRWGETQGPEHIAFKMIERVAKKVSDATQGRIQIQGYPSSQLGSSKEMIEAVVLGTQQAVTEGTANFAQWVPSIGVTEAPYVWRDAAHLAKVMAGPIGEDLNKQLIERRGMRILGTTYYGVRQLTTTNKLVRTAADMKEFKLRVPENEIFLAMARSWGAKPTPMTFGELYLALRQNVVDGQENPLPTIDSGKFFEVQKYLVLTAHILTPRIVAMNEKFWQALSAADRQVISEAVAEGIAWNNQQTQAAEQTLLEKFRKAGMEVIQPDYDSFRKPVVETVPKMFEAKWGKGLFEKIVETR